jgi:serine/threonine-protein kinase
VVVVELRAGVRLDRYTLVICLGEGGQASVWKAIDPLDGGGVRALKIFQLRGSDEHNTDRARREAKASAGAQHPGLLPCRLFFEDPALNVAVLVFDYERGRSLADAMSDPRMTQEHRRCALRQLADTLAYVHARSVIHRDIKPDNVLVTDAFWGSPTEPGTLKLVDFGIAAPAGNPKPLTREGGVVGTAPYLPPELLETSGLFPTGQDYQRDVFAFGVLAWEVLIGGHPTGLPLGASRQAFAGAYLGARAGKRAWPPAAPPSPDLSIVQECLALSSAERPQSCIVVANALQTGVLDGVRARTSEPVAVDRRNSRPVTDVHVAPTTAPMGAPQHSWAASSRPVPPRVAVVGGPREPVYSGSSRPAAQKKKSWGGLLVGIGLVTAAAASVVVYFAVRQPDSEESPPPSVWTAPPAITLAPKPSVETPAPARAQVVCCSSDGKACASGRDCQPQPCDGLLGDGPWRLRVIGGFLGSGTKITEIQRTWQSSFICLKNTRTGEEQCASSYAMWTKGYDARNRVLATTGDMIAGRIEVRVMDGGVERIRAPGFGYPTGYKTTALCSNVTLHLGSWATSQGKISVYLDDP